MAPQPPRHSDEKSKDASEPSQSNAVIRQNSSSDESNSDAELNDPQSAGYEPLPAVDGSAYDNSLLDDSGNATLSTTMNGTTTASNVDDNAEEDEHDRLSGFPRALRGDFEQAVATAKDRHLKQSDFAISAHERVDNIPLDAEKIAAIRTVMAKIEVPNPQWTSKADESIWLNALRQKIGEQPVLVSLGAPVNRTEEFADFDSPAAKEALPIDNATAFLVQTSLANFVLPLRHCPKWSTQCNDEKIRRFLLARLRRLDNSVEENFANFEAYFNDNDSEK